MKPHEKKLVDLEEQDIDHIFKERLNDIDET